MTYTEKLKDPRWQKKRLEVFKRDDFKCLLCTDDKETLHVHHKKYTGKNPWDSPDEDLETLCATCHGLIEHYKHNTNYGKTISVDKYSAEQDLIVTVSYTYISEDNLAVCFFSKNENNVYTPMLSVGQDNLYSITVKLLTLIENG